MKIITLIFLVISSFLEAQQLNCSVVINTQKLNNPNQQIFKTLETSLTEFINKTNWNETVVKLPQRINCSFYITLSNYDSDQFSGTIQVQSSRVVYNSSYFSPIINHNDSDFKFSYTPFQNLIYNPNSFDSNLVSIISFYCNLILAMDADSLGQNLGDKSFQTAQDIANLAQQGGSSGWNPTDGVNSRFFLIKNLTSLSYKATRQAVYHYHQGLDMMSIDLKSAKQKIKDALITLEKTNSESSNPTLISFFFNAKLDEIVSIFSGGPDIPITDLKESLQKMSPTNSYAWEKIKL